MKIDEPQPTIWRDPEDGETYLSIRINRFVHIEIGMSLNALKALREQCNDEINEKA